MIYIIIIAILVKKIAYFFFPFNLFYATWKLYLSDSWQELLKGENYDYPAT